MARSRDTVVMGRSTDWLVREVLKGVGDLVVLEPEEARSAVLEAVSKG
jgi:predicted DNA-binding transcriptional regulator YafY